MDQLQLKPIPWRTMNSYVIIFTFLLPLASRQDLLRTLPLSWDFSPLPLICPFSDIQVHHLSAPPIRLAPFCPLSLIAFVSYLCLLILNFSVLLLFLLFTSFSLALLFASLFVFVCLFVCNFLSFLFLIIINFCDPSQCPTTDHLLIHNISY